MKNNSRLSVAGSVAEEPKEVYFDNFMEKQSEPAETNSSAVRATEGKARGTVSGEAQTGILLQHNVVHFNGVGSDTSESTGSGQKLYSGSRSSSSLSATTAVCLHHNGGLEDGDLMPASMMEGKKSQVAYRVPVPVLAVLDWIRASDYCIRFDYFRASRHN
jgi:hypothetical protein